MEEQGIGRQGGDGGTTSSRLDGQNLNLVGEILGFKDSPIFQLDAARIDSQRLPLHYEIAHFINKEGTTNLESLIQTTDINLQDEHGNTALHLLAISNNSTALTPFLRNSSLDPNIRNHNGQTALHLAVLANNLHAVKSLLAEDDRVDCTVFDDYGNSPFHYAAIQADEELLDFLIDSSKWNAKTDNLFGRNPLHIAAEGTSKCLFRSSAILLLLDKGCPCHCPITGKDADGNSPYNMVVRHSRELVDTLPYKIRSDWKKDHLIAVKALLDQNYIGSGCLNRRNNANKSPLQEAYEGAFTSHGADILDLVLESLRTNLGTFDVDDSSLNDRLGPILHYSLRTEDHSLPETRTKRLIRGPYALQLCSQVSLSTGKSVLHLLAEGVLENNPELLREISKIIGTESAGAYSRLTTAVDKEGYTALHRAIIAAESGKTQALKQWFLLPTSKSAPLIKFPPDANSGPLKDTHLHVAARALPAQTFNRVFSVFLYWNLGGTLNAFQKTHNKMGFTADDLHINKNSLPHRIWLENIRFLRIWLSYSHEILLIVVFAPVVFIVNFWAVRLWIDRRISNWVFEPRRLESAAAEGDPLVGGLQKYHYRASSREKAWIKIQTMLDERFPVPIAWYPWLSPLTRTRRITGRELTYLWEDPPHCPCTRPDLFKEVPTTTTSKASFESSASSIITAINPAATNSVQPASPQPSVNTSLIKSSEDYWMLICTETTRLTPFLQYERKVSLSQIPRLRYGYDHALEKILKEIRDKRAKAAGFWNWRTIFGVFEIAEINVVKFRLLPGSDTQVEILDTQRCGHKLTFPESNYISLTDPSKKSCIADPRNLAYHFQKGKYCECKLGWWLCEAPKHRGGPFTRTGKPTDECIGYGMHVVEGIKIQKVVRLLVFGGVSGVASALGIWIGVGNAALAIGVGVGVVLAAWVWVLLVQILVGIGR